MCERDLQADTYGLKDVVDCVGEVRGVAHCSVGFAQLEQRLGIRVLWWEEELECRVWSQPHVNHTAPIALPLHKRYILSKNRLQRLYLLILVKDGRSGGEEQTGEKEGRGRDERERERQEEETLGNGAYAEFSRIVSHNLLATSDIESHTTHN
jgi:hypothetical protein